MEATDTKNLLAELLGNLNENQLQQAREYLEQLKSRGSWAESRLVQEFLASIEPEAIRSVPEHLCQRYKVLGLALHNGDSQIELAIADPLDVVALDDVHLITGREVLPRKVEPELIQAGLEHFFGTTAIDAVIEVMKDISATDMGPLDYEYDDDEFLTLEKLKEMVDEAPIVRVVNMILSQAFVDGASHVHIDPRSKYTDVRYRIDGILYPLMRIPKHIHQPVLSRLKVMAGVEIWKKSVLASNRFELTHDGHPYEMLVSFARCPFGDKAVVKIIDKTRPMLTFAELGVGRTAANHLNQLLDRPRGLVVVTGPSRSGVSTLVGFFLNRLATASRHVLSYQEDMGVELGHLNDGINVVCGERNRQQDGPDLLDSLRQLDPDVLSFPKLESHHLGGLLRFSASEGIGVSTMDLAHTLAVLPRLLELGASPTMLAEGLSGVVTQRLARKICSNCKEPHETEQGSFWRGRGCEECKNSGFRGRTGIHEVLVITPRLRELLASGASLTELRQAAEDEGLWNLGEDAQVKASEGLISLDEARRLSL